MSVRPLVVLAALLVSASLFAADPWDAPPFSADPKALLDAAAGVSEPNADVVLLLHELRYVFEADGSSHTEARYVYSVLTPRGVQFVKAIGAPWAPWYEEKPSLQARVVLKDGSVRTLEPSAITEASAAEEQDMYSDERVLRAPLPGVEPGAVVEELITHNAHDIFPGSGKNAEFAFQRPIPAEHLRLILEGPANFAPHIVNKSTVEQRVVEEGGRKRFIFESGRTAPSTVQEDRLPFDDMGRPYVAFSTGSSWRDMAKQYSATVDKQIAAGDVREVVAAAAAGASKRDDVIARLLAYVESNVHYAGVEVAEGSIIPRPPKGVLSNKYGDCKDKATLLVALLRAAGIPAHVALLDAGFDFDVIEALPGLSRFNHAIVVTGGPKPIWIDPTDEYARPGELPPPDQGRMALIASPDTTSLTRTPELATSANVTAEVRTFTLPEDGKAHVVEVLSATGPSDASFRRTCAQADRTKYDDAVKEYANNFYGSTGNVTVKMGDPHDAAKAFHVTIDVASSKLAVVGNGDGAVALHAADLVNVLPNEFLDYREPSAGDTGEPSHKPRVHDFQLWSPGVRERTYRIVPPPGYRARTLPQNEIRQLGTMLLTKEFSTHADGTVIAKFRFDGGKRRLTPAEFEQTRMEISRFTRSDAVIVGFESVGVTKLNAGDVGGAIAEFRRLAAMHPAEALHHIDISRALLAGGLGETARAEARRAVEIEPSSAKAHANLGWILSHDLLGRQYNQGCNLPGAIAELRKAKELDPNDPQQRGMLAEVLSWGDDGMRFGRNAHINESIAEYQSMLDELGNDGKAIEPQLMLVLVHAGRWDEAKKHLDTVADGEQRKLFRVLIAAGTEGADAAKRELDRFDADHRRNYATEVAATLLSLHRYPDAAALYEAANEGTPNASDMRPLIDVIKRAKHIDYAADRSPRGLAVQLITAMVGDDSGALKRLLPPGSVAEDDDLEGFHLGAAPFGMKDFSIDVATDLIAAMVEVQIDGSEATGQRVRARVPAVGDIVTLVVTHEKSGNAIAAVLEERETVARAVTKLVDAGKLEEARIWLNWMREIETARGGDDPLNGPPFAMIWPKEKGKATADEVRLAVAVLHYAAPNGVETLLAARDKATDEQRKWIDSTLLADYLQKKEYAKAIEVGQRLTKGYPDSEYAFGGLTAALIYADRPAEAEALAKERLERLPHDAAALRMLYSAAAKRHDYASAGTAIKRLVDQLTPTPNDYNNAAWLALFSGKDFEKAIDWAHRASSNKTPAAAASLHTLAALYATTGKSAEAREALLQSMELRFSREPKPFDWYVVGRIAENYGVHDAALAAYKRVEKEKESDNGLTTFELAQKRLEAIK